LIEGHPQFVINPLLNDTDFQAAIEISSVAISMTGCKKFDRTGPALQSIVQRIRHHDGENGISTNTELESTVGVRGRKYAVRDHEAGVMMVCCTSA
jgi:hypothetical protein